MTIVWNHILAFIDLLTTFPLPKSFAEPLLSFGEVGLLVSAFVVVVGLIGEYFVEKRKESRFPIVLYATFDVANLKPPRKWNWWVIWAAAIVLGIIIEFLGDAVIWRSSDSLQEIANRNTEELRTKNNELEREIAPRDFSDDELARIKKTLDPYRGRPVLIQSYFGDTEGHRFLFVVAHALGQAKLELSYGYWSPAGPPSMDILLGMEIDAPPEQADLASALVAAFKSTRLGVRPKWFPIASGSPVTIHIGVKPFSAPFLEQPSAKTEP